jgi:hypothetical protein
MLLSGLDRIHDGDTRFVNFILEHSWGWLTGQRGHESFWDPPLFWPARGTAAYSETLLGVAPLYWLFRAGGVRPDSSLQGWMFAVSLLNFASSYALLARLFRFDRLPAAAGAFLFSFGAVRINQLIHPQLVPHFYTVLAVFAAGRCFEGVARRESPWKTARWTALFTLAVALQLWACFYLGWFLGVALGLCAIWALALEPTRRTLFALLRHQRWALAGAVALGAALVLPMAHAHLSAQASVGIRAFGEVATMLPRPASWIDVGPWSWLYGWIHASGVYDHIPMEHEQRLGIGLLTPLFCIAGLALLRQHPGVRVMILATSTFVVLTLWWPRWGFSAWEPVYLWAPGAGAIRAVSRFAILGLLPAAIGLTAFAQSLDRPGRRRALPLAFAVIVLEQGLSTPTFDKQRVRADAMAIAERVDPNCAAFLYTPMGSVDSVYEPHLDAMTAQMITGVPTVNGASGHVPPGWLFDDVTIQTPSDEARIQRALERWVAAHSIHPTRICRVRLPPPG